MKARVVVREHRMDQERGVPLQVIDTFEVDVGEQDDLARERVRVAVLGRVGRAPRSLSHLVGGGFAVVVPRRV